MPWAIHFQDIMQGILIAVVVVTVLRETGILSCTMATTLIELETSNLDGILTICSVFMSLKLCHTLLTCRVFFTMLYCCLKDSKSGFPGNIPKILYNYMLCQEKGNSAEMNVNLNRMERSNKWNIVADGTGQINTARRSIYWHKMACHVRISTFCQLLCVRFRKDPFIVPESNRTFAGIILFPTSICANITGV